MPAERLSMRKIRELLRLRFEAELSMALIARALGMSKASVGEYLGRAKAAGVSWPLPGELGDAELERRLFPLPRHWRAEGPPRPEPNWAYVDRELRRKGVTRVLLWQEHRVEHPDGYGYAWFCETSLAPEVRANSTSRSRSAHQRSRRARARSTSRVSIEALNSWPNCARRSSGTRRRTYQVPSETFR